MGINNPVPRSLAKESRKAAAILASFVKPNQMFGADMVIPPEILSSARGLAVITVLKAGFLFSGRAGSGVIVARLPDGSWSAPSAIVTAGAGVGGQIGAELTDFVFILNTDAAVKTFSRAGSITLGGNISVAAGPLGRNAEAGGSLSTGGAAAIFSYSKTKGLYAGVSLEGSVLIERREANRKFYGPNCTAQLILAGQVEPPAECDSLFRVLESRAFRGHRASDDYNYSDDEDFYNDIPSFNSESDSDYARSENYSRSSRGSISYNDNNNNSHRSQTSWNNDADDQKYTSSSRVSNLSNNDGRRGGAGGNRRDYDSDDDYNTRDNDRFRRDSFKSTYSDKPSRPQSAKPNFGSPQRDSNSRQGGRGRDYDDNKYNYKREPESERRNPPTSTPPPSSVRTRAPDVEKAVALFTFDGEQDGDLGFRKGDVVNIVKRSESKDDWWTGRIGGREGIFPANYVELM